MNLHVSVLLDTFFRVREVPLLGGHIIGGSYNYYKALLFLSLDMNLDDSQCKSGLCRLYECHGLCL